MKFEDLDNDTVLELFDLIYDKHTKLDTMRDYYNLETNEILLEDLKHIGVEE